MLIRSANQCPANTIGELVNWWIGELASRGYRRAFIARAVARAKLIHQFTNPPIHQFHQFTNSPIPQN
jgi:hypothetical protein